MYDRYFEKRVQDAANLAAVTYTVDSFFCFKCETSSRLEDGKYLPARCPKCNNDLQVKGACTVPDGIIKLGARYGLVYVDGSVHGKYEVMMSDDRTRQHLFGNTSQGESRRIFAFVIKNVEIGKPRKITKQKHEEFMPTQVTVGNLVNFNLSSIILGWSVLMTMPIMYESVMRQEREIIGLGQNAGIKRVR